MLVFLNFGAGGFGGRWYIGPLLTLLPLLLQTGLLGLPLRLLSLLLGFGSADTYSYDSSSRTWHSQAGRSVTGAPSSIGSGSGSSGARGAAAAVAGGSRVVPAALVGLTSMLVTAALTVLLLKLVMAVRQDGLRPTLRRILFEGFGGGWQQQQGQQRRVGQTRSQRIEHVAKLMQGLPLETYYSRAELEVMPVGQLKQLIKARDIECRDCLEKRELVDSLAAEGGNSTAASCSICCEDYQPGDVLRALRCAHRFHLECVDRWFLSSTDYSRPPACPMCNAELVDSSSGGGGAGSSGAPAAAGGGSGGGSSGGGGGNSRPAAAGLGGAGAGQRQQGQTREAA